MAPTPLTVLTPVPLWWSLWVRFTWAVAAVTGGLVQRRLRHLSFIHFAHWSLVGRWPRDPAVSPDEAAPRTLVFLTNFDGSDIQYIDAFVRVVPDQIEALYAGARGFPGARRFRPVAKYIAEHSHPVDHFYAAHPEATTTAIGQALVLRMAFEVFEARVAAAGDDHERFAREWETFLTSVQGVLQVPGATECLILLARVRAGEADAARAAIAAHWERAARSPFAAVAGTHLARLQVLAPPARRGRRGTRECVLLAADVDAPLAPWLERFRALAAAPLDAVLGHCAFYPGSADPAGFRRWVTANRLPAGFSVIGSPDATLAEVGAALDLRERLGAFAERTQRMSAADLHAAWREWRGG